MRIAFLTKRRYMRHDVIADRYARLYELPFNLARHGHEVLGICLSYRHADEGRFLHDGTPGRLEWTSSNTGLLLFPGMLRYLQRTQRLLEEFKPDAILGASDALHVVIARHLAGRLRIPYAVDLYDNFESFGLTRIPFLRGLYRHAVRDASAVSCVSAQLASLVRNEYAACGIIETLESTIGGNDFSPLERRYCRNELGLPQDAKLIGTAGALDTSRGINELFEAFNALASRDERVHLVLAGTPDRRRPLPAGSKVHYLGQLPHARVPLLYGALDVGVICVRNTAFGRYSFPQKAYEMAAMRIPLVVAAVGAMRDLFRPYPDCLYRPDVPGELAHKLARQLASPVVPDVPIPTWTEQTRRLESLLRSAIGHG